MGKPLNFSSIKMGHIDLLYAVRDSVLNKMFYTANQLN